MTILNLDSFEQCRIAVIGDIMLDRYVEGEVDRISPEAPVPVLRVVQERAVPGGAANVAANLAALGINVSLIGITGEDNARLELIAALQSGGRTDCKGILALADRRTTQKLRVIGSRQQIVRIDHEDISYCSPDAEQQLVEFGKDAISTADLVILSDYGKGALSDGVLSALLRHALALSKTVIVDPKRPDFTAYRGATILTPNRQELSQATGMPCETDEEAAAAAAAAQRACGADILLTRSEKGMSYFGARGAPLHLTTAAQDVFDVSGAGDTVVAVAAAAIAAGFGLSDAMRLANHGAGIVVSKIGTASISRMELAFALQSDSATDDAEGKLVSIEEAVALRWAWARDKLSVGVANGCFDLIHPGHAFLIQQAAQSCDRLILALNSDASVRRLKGVGRPLQDERSRATVAGAMRGIAAVTIFEDDTPLELIKSLQPDVLIKGADYTEDRVVGADVIRQRGGRVVLATLQPGHSTTRLALRAASGDCPSGTASRPE